MKKKTSRFPLARRGYSKEAVDSYILLEQQKFDSAQLAERERVSSLKEQVENLTAQLAELKGKEEQIKAAYISAAQSAQKLTSDVRVRYAMELDRLRLFRAKWTANYEQLKDRYHFDKDALNMESVAVSVELELRKFLEQDFSLSSGGGNDEMEQYFKSEVDRLTKKQIEESAKESAADESESSSFSLDEALHPTESLADICRALGLKAL